MKRIRKKYYNNNKIYSIMLALIMILVYNLSIQNDLNKNYSYINANKDNYLHKKIALSGYSLKNNNEYIKVSEKFDVDEFGKVKRENNTEFLSSKYNFSNSTINEKYKKEYDNLKQAILNHEKEYIFNADSVSKAGYQNFVKDIWQHLRSEDGISRNVIFKTAKASGQAVNDNYENLKISFGFDYNVDKNEEENYKSQIKNIVNSFQNCNSDFEKANAINNYLLKNATYAIEEYNSGKKFLSDGMSIHSPYTILAHKKGVCTAFAELYKMMADELGLETKVVTGDAFSFGKWGSHAWNIVKIDGKWYHLDASWNKESDHPDYHNKYFLVGDNAMTLDHRWNENDFPSMSKIDQNLITIYNY